MNLENIEENNILSGQNLIKCIACEQEKDKSEYYKDKNKALGIKDRRCRSCHKDYKNNKNEIIKKQYENTDNPITKEGLLKLYDYTDHDKKIGKKTCYSSVFIGGSKSGKTTIIKGLIMELKNTFDLIVIFSHSFHEAIYEFIDYDIKSNYICFDYYKKQVINELFEINKHTKNSFNFLILFDDMISNQIKESDEILQCFTRGRNSGINIYYSVQYYTLLNSASRTNSNYIYLLKTGDSDIRETLARKYLNGILKAPPNLTSKSKKLEWYDQYMLEKTNNQLDDKNNQPKYIYSIVIDKLANPAIVYNYKHFL